jgi:ABC-type multidrug transport system fused ATPase/permease subunit
MKEDELRPIKTSDFKLLFDLWPMTKSMRPLMLAGVLMIILASLVSLVLPYLTKVAIDSHILPMGRKIGPRESIPPELMGTLMADVFLESGNIGVFLLKNKSASKIDKRQERILVSEGILDPERYYLKKMDEGFGIKDAELIIRDLKGKPALYPNFLVVRERDLLTLSGSASLVLRDADLKSLKTLAFLFAGLMILAYFFDFGQRVILETASQKLGHNLRESLLSHLFGLSQSFFDRSEAGRLTSRLTSDINNINSLIKSTAASFFSDILSLVGVTVVMFGLSPKLALIALCLTPLALLVSWYFSKVARALQRNLRSKVAAINQYFSETRMGVKIIKALRRENESKRIFEELNYENYKVGLKQVHSFAIFLPLVDLLATSVLALILYFGGAMVLDNMVSLGVLAAFVGYSNRFFAPVKDLAEKMNTFQSAFASMERINDLFAADDRTLPVGPPVLPKSPGGEISFKNVCFSYGKDLPMVLKNVSFRVKKGETLALVGETGSGKSSVISLMLRFYDPQEGEILFDGTPLKTLDLKSHRKRIGLVTQDVYLYGGTVMENLRLGREDIPLKKVIEAAEKTGASRFIEKLPKGYDERLGSEGKSLSAGQRQLLACARALIDAPEFVILDEATAFVDSESELLISKAMREIFKGRTSIIIAHRLSTIRHSDRILVLNHGQIAEEGNHDTLIRQNGLYHHLARLQSLDG